MKAVGLQGTRPVVAVTVRVLTIASDTSVRRWWIDCTVGRLAIMKSGSLNNMLNDLFVVKMSVLRFLFQLQPTQIHYAPTAFGS